MEPETPSKGARLARYVASVLIDPWRDAARVKVMLAGALGCFGLCLLDMALSYTMAGQTLANNLIFQITRLMVMGLVVIGFSFWLCRQPMGRLWILLLQAASFGLLILASTSPLACGLGFALIGGTFWASYNIRFALKQSIKNNAREMSLGLFFMTVVSSLGLWAGGLLLQMHLYRISLAAGLILVTVATQILFQPFQSENLLKAGLALARGRPISTSITLFSGFLSVIQTSCLPAWFRVMGISPLSTGTLLALQPILGFFFAPVVGNLVQKGALRSIRSGSVILLIGWSLMFATVSIPWLLAPTLGFLAVGTSLIVTTEATRWYKNRTPVGITTREVILALGRGPTFLLALPLAFLAPFFYPALPIAASSLFAFRLLPRRRFFLFNTVRPSPD